MKAIIQIELEQYQYIHFNDLVSAILKALEEKEPNIEVKEVQLVRYN